ncbi:MAG TPA: tRNA lysidine(34) synthetase TilS [Methylocella sp.]|nr:tRNA lysidine(34) synthetase TilS [Methylocella sp.]
MCKRPEPGRPYANLAGERRARSAKTPSHAPAKAGFTASDIGALFSPWEAARGIVLGVSGGPVSVALMLLAAEWARARARPPPLYVATVDHGLRQDSRGEAEMVARWAAGLALPHAILVWDGVKPKSRIQERAREARYELLFDCATRIGADHVMTAHHADDQAETILLRLLRGSGVSGLSGMASSSDRNGLILARPLLAHAKADLATLCESRAHPFFDDPSNTDPVYARTRIRRLGGLLADEGLGRAALLRLGRRAARADAALAARARAVRAGLAARREPGGFRADISALAEEPEEILLRFLAHELKLISGGKALRLDRLEALALRFRQALRAGIAFTATLGGAALRLQSNRTLVIAAENGRAAARPTHNFAAGPESDVRLT